MTTNQMAAFGRGFAHGRRLATEQVTGRRLTVRSTQVDTSQALIWNVVGQGLKASMRRNQIR